MSKGGFGIVAGSSTSYRSRLVSFCNGRVISRRERKEDNMLIRHATLALLIAVLGAPPASAQKLNYLSQIIDVPELIPPPPPSDSQAFKDDLLGVMEAQENRTEAQLRRALAEKTLTIYHYT